MISPYNAQGKKLRKRLQTQYENIDVGSVEQFQGQVRGFVISIPSAGVNPSPLHPGEKSYLDHDGS